MLFPSQNSFQVIQGFKIHKQTLHAVIFQNCAINEFQEKIIIWNQVIFKKSLSN